MRGELEVWKHPANYGGFSPDGDYLILSRHRDSDILTESNWDGICRDLEAEAYDGEHFAARPAVYHWRARHWAVGWVEYLMIRQDAPAQLIERAQGIASDLDSYPIYDESDFCDRENEVAESTWCELSIAERVELCQDAGISIFAARHGYIPRDDAGFIFEHCRGS